MIDRRFRLGLNLSAHSQLCSRPHTALSPHLWLTVIISSMFNINIQHRTGTDWSLTGSPQRLALAVHAGADSSIAVGGALLTGFPVLQKYIGGTVGGGACAVLREVTFPERLTTHRTRRSQLMEEEEEELDENTAGNIVFIFVGIDVSLTLQSWQQIPSDEH